ncbi:Ventricular zone-expressed PH domain-containing protein-like protein 1 [Trichoplax sp. H2]|nr:Ventricular zone-expressed PH domain-containing protein-like protein 1 [Trichoplax sp. H2]|eukprot:RDD39562.1 Ventricular zone-expressed PH domain-containing protein-like protein 1 [Trichoplax sp. H2]
MLIKPKKVTLNHMPDNYIRDNVDDILIKIHTAIASPEFISNNNEKQAVAVCLERVLTVIKNDDLIDQHYERLIRIWEICLEQPLSSTSKYEVEHPHVTIATDVASCLFQKYHKSEIMEKAVPVAFQFLHENNPSLIRLITVRLCRVTMDMPRLVAPHSQEIIDILKKIKMPVLCRILPHIFNNCPDLISSNVNIIIRQLSKADVVEKVAILQTIGLIAKHKPEAVKSYKDVLLQYLDRNDLSILVLAICETLAQHEPLIFFDNLSDITAACRKDPTLFGYELGIRVAIGLNDEKHAKKMLYDMSQMLRTEEEAKYPLILAEMKKIGDRYPQQIRSRLSTITNVSNKARSRSVRAFISDLDLENYTQNIKNSTAEEPTSDDVMENNEQIQQSRTTPPIKEETKNVTAAKSDEIQNGNMTNGIKENGEIEHGEPSHSMRSSLSNASLNSVIHAKEPKIASNTAPEEANSLDLNSIKIFVSETVQSLPILRAFSRSSYGEPEIILHFKCTKRNPGCMFNGKHFSVKTSQVTEWMKYSFCAMKAGRANWKQNGKSSNEVIKNFEVAVNDPFITAQERREMREELVDNRFYEAFQFNKTNKSWYCFICSNPDKAEELVRDGIIWFAGKLRKKGHNFSHFWHERFFTLTQDSLVNRKENDDTDVKTTYLKDILAIRLADNANEDNPVFIVKTEEKSMILRAEDMIIANRWVLAVNLASIIAQNQALELAPR